MPSKTRPPSPAAGCVDTPLTNPPRPQQPKGTPKDGARPSPGSAGFSGSYTADDVVFLLKPLTMEPIEDVAFKEYLIQTGQRHYSEVIGVEWQPDAEYVRLFEAAVAENLDRMATDVWALARRLLEARPDGIVLVSLARAGTPIGVALRRLLGEGFGVEAPHYSISIIRDRGIDTRALDYIFGLHEPAHVAFIDGWTGKGAIAAELQQCLSAPGQQLPPGLTADLFVLVDLAGVATACGSTDDYLIPSAILNATVSGLVSRTILNELIGPSDFHGCLFYEHLRPLDRSVWFVNLLHARAMELLPRLEAGPPPAVDPVEARKRTESLVADIQERYSIADRNHIKPGIGEATRALLRRTPRLLIVRDPGAPCTRHLQLLASKRAIPVVIEQDLPVAAIAVIRRLVDG